jgi:hypothetical protein
MQQPDFPGWRHFVVNHWETKPLTFRDPDSGLCDEHAVFNGIKSAAADLREGTIRDHRDVTFHLENAVLVDPGPYLPHPPESLEQYLARLEHLLPRQPFTLLVNNFQEFSPSLCLCMRRFARSLFEHLGWLPAGMVSSHVMLARYTVSPFAVHKDPNSVFTFLIRGEKTLRVWPFEVFADRTQQPCAVHRQLNLYDFDYRSFLNQGIALTGQAGDVLYWPSTYWHVGETEADDSIHISLHFTFDVHSEPRGEVVDLLHKLVEGSLSENDWHSGYPVDCLYSNCAIQTPVKLIQTLRTFTDQMQETIEDSIGALWLGRMSAQGFWTLAKPADNGTAESASTDFATATLRADPIFSVYWTIIGERVKLAAHGRVIEFPLRAWTNKILAAFADRRPFKASEFVQPTDPAWDEITVLMTKLIAIRAVETVSESCSTSAN